MLELRVHWRCVLEGQEITLRGRHLPAASLCSQHGVKLAGWLFVLL